MPMIENVIELTKFPRLKLSLLIFEHQLRREACRTLTCCTESDPRSLPRCYDNGT